jgi:hypothetical protein
MKDIELIAEAIARDAAIACVAAVVKRDAERRGVNSLPRAEAIRRLDEMAKRHIGRAVERMADNWPDLNLLMSMPPINPS